MFFKCPKCENEYNRLDILARHWGRYHRTSKEELYLIINNLDSAPTCKCGCGKPTKFLNVTQGYRQFILGHVARMPGKNNWGNNKKALRRSQETRRKMWSKGQLKAWNKGLSKETNIIIAKNAQKSSETILSNLEERKRRSERMRKNRLNGIIPTLYGPQHSQWKGGTSTIRNLLGSNKKLYYEWKLPKLKLANFTCEECKTRTGPLHVHHNDISMSQILKIIARKHNFDAFFKKTINNIPEEIKAKIIDEVTKYHVQNNISGIVLCEICHKKKHKHLNF